MFESVNKRWTDRLYAVLTSYSPIPDKEWELFLSKIRVVDVKKNDFFIKEGEVPYRFGFIISGLFRVYYTSESAEEKVLVFREENRALTAFSAFLEDRKSGISLQALENSTLLTIPTKEFREIIKRHSCWEVIIGKFTQDIYLEKEKREREFLSDDAETRYRKFLEKYPGFDKRISQYHIASYLGISHVTLSRIRNMKY